MNSEEKTIVKKKVKNILFNGLLILAPILLWLGVEFVANRITHRFDPLLVDRDKGTLYINQEYFDDFFLYDLDEFLTTSSSNRAIRLQKGNRFRIFCYGGSTTAGYPYNTFPAFECPSSFPNYLRAILQYNPAVGNIEMLNLGCNALNSLHVLSLFKETIKYDPDLAIVYCGHNEYFGPNEFTVPKDKTLFYQNPDTFPLFMKIRRTFLYQGLRKFLGNFTDRFEKKHQDYFQWARQNAITANDPMHEKVEANYRRNIEEIVSLARQNKIPLVLCTPIANVTFPPFIAKYEKKFSKEEIARLDSLDNLGREHYNNEEYEKAIDYFSSLKQADSTFADAWYHTGMTYVRMKAYKNAADELYQAKDYDALPFRAKSFIYNVLYQTANRYKVPLAELEPFFTSISQKYYPAPSQLIDHVHPTDSGYYYVALFLSRFLVENGFFPGVGQLRFPDLESCRRVLGIEERTVDRIEYEFPEGSFFDRLSKLNPEIAKYLNFIKNRAEQRIEKRKLDTAAQEIFK